MQIRRLFPIVLALVAGFCLVSAIRMALSNGAIKFPFLVSHKFKREPIVVPEGKFPPTARKGSSVPLVTVMGFGTFSCEACVAAGGRWTKAMQGIDGSVSLVYRYLPSQQKGWAKVDQAVVTLSGFDEFFTLQRLVESLSKPVEPKDVLNLATSIASARSLTLSDFPSNVTLTPLITNVQLAKHLGVKILPTFFVNGRRIEGDQSIDTIRGVLSQELSLAGKLVAQGMDSERIMKAILTNEGLPTNLGPIGPVASAPKTCAPPDLRITPGSAK